MEDVRPSYPALSPGVEAFWFLKSEPASEPYRLPPDPGGTLILRLLDHGRGRKNGGYTVNGHYCTGLRSFPVTLDPRGPVDYIAVQLKPHALRSHLGIHAREVEDYLLELNAVSPSFSRDVSDSLKDHRDTSEAVWAIKGILFNRLLRTSFEPPRYLTRAVERIAAASGRLNIPELCDEIGITPRQLKRKFDRWVGQPAKLFVWIVRMNAALSLLRDHDTQTDIALALGDYDQSHLCSEFADLVGMSPKRVIEKEPSR